MPRAPAPVRIVTPKHDDAEHHQYAVRIHTAHEPSGRRTTINREAVVESATPEVAAAAAVVHIAHTLRNEGREPPDGTRYQVSIHGESENMDWTLVVQHRPAADGGGRHGSGRPESTYRQRADDESGPVRTRAAERSRPETRIGTAATPGDGTSRYFVRVVSQKSGSDEWLPLDTAGEIVARSPTQAAEKAVEDFRKQMPGLIGRHSSVTVYMVDVVRAADERLPYDAWHIEVTYEAKKGPRGSRVPEAGETVH